MQVGRRRSEACCTADFAEVETSFNVVTLRLQCKKWNQQQGGTLSFKNEAQQLGGVITIITHWDTVDVTNATYLYVLHRTTNAYYTVCKRTLYVGRSLNINANTRVVLVSNISFQHRYGNCLLRRNMDVTTDLV